MTQLIEQYIDSLLRDPHAAPPEEMDAGTAAFVRAMVAAGTTKPTAVVRARIWQQALNNAKMKNGMQNHVIALPHSTNGHHHSLSALPAQQPSVSSRFRGILTLAAACALVLFGILLLTMARIPADTQNLTGAEQSSGSPTPTETATPLATSTPVPMATVVAPDAAIEQVIEYTIRPGDTLLGIIQSLPFSFSDPHIVDKIIALNPTVNISQLTPGETILIPVPTPAPTLVPTLPGTRLPSNLAAIMNDLQSLSGEADAGRVSFEAMACSACHDNEAISTLTEMLWQSAEDIIRRLPQFSGYTVEMYLVESIIHPSAYVVPGYANLMPDSYRENLTLQQLADLIAYMRSFAQPARTPTSTPISATDIPIVVTSDELLTATEIIARTTETAVEEMLQLTATQLIQEATREAAVAGSPTPTAVPAEVTTYTIQSGDTLLDIALRFDTTLPMLAELNPQLDFTNCDFTRLSGGSNCTVLLRVGERLIVPEHHEGQPIITTSTPIPSHNATVTPIPTATPA